MIDQNLCITLITSFNPSPVVSAKRDKKIASVKRQMGSTWLFHPDNHIKPNIKHGILDKWMATRVKS